MKKALVLLILFFVSCSINHVDLLEPQEYAGFFKAIVPSSWIMKENLETFGDVYSNYYSIGFYDLPQSSDDEFNENILVYIAKLDSSIDLETYTYTELVTLLSGLYKNFTLLTKASSILDSLQSYELTFLWETFLNDHNLFLKTRLVTLQSNGYLYHIFCNAEDSVYNKYDLNYFSPFLNSFEILK